MAELKVLLDPGHGSGSAHNRGFLSPGNEGESNYYMAIALERELKAYGITVGRTRKTIHENPTLAQRGAMAKGYDLLLSKIISLNCGSKSLYLGILPLNPIFYHKYNKYNSLQCIFSYFCSSKFKML